MCTGFQKPKDNLIFGESSSLLIVSRIIKAMILNTKTIEILYIINKDYSDKVSHYLSIQDAWLWLIANQASTKDEIILWLLKNYAHNVTAPFVDVNDLGSLSTYNLR